MSSWHPHVSRIARRRGEGVLAVTRITPENAPDVARCAVGHSAAREAARGRRIEETLVALWVRGQRRDLQVRSQGTWGPAPCALRFDICDKYIKIVIFYFYIGKLCPWLGIPRLGFFQIGPNWATWYVFEGERTSGGYNANGASFAFLSPTLSCDARSTGRVSVRMHAWEIICRCEQNLIN